MSKEQFSMQRMQFGQISFWQRRDKKAVYEKERQCKEGMDSPAVKYGSDKMAVADPRVRYWKDWVLHIRAGVGSWYPLEWPDDRP